ncbi:bacteriohemerythrin [Candidatus Latescibacterota bacterium]
MRLLFNTELCNVPAFNWRKEYSLHNKEMDNQHMKFFKTANDACEAVHAGKGKEEIEQALTFRVEYTETHFTAEEKLMKQHEFTGYSEHCKEHQRLMEEVRALQGKFERSELFIKKDVVKILRNWINDHILTEDRKYSTYLHEKGVSLDTLWKI